MSEPAPRLIYRFAAASDAPLLATMNKHLIEDEGHSNPMTLIQLEARMRQWLQSAQYRGVLFWAEEPAPAAYALYREDNTHSYIRHFFVARTHRRRGLGREAFQLLQTEILPASHPIMMDVLAANQRGYTFWQSLGFEAYAVRMVLPPLSAGDG